MLKMRDVKYSNARRNFTEVDFNYYEIKDTEEITELIDKEKLTMIRSNSDNPEIYMYNYNDSKCVIFYYVNEDNQYYYMVNKEDADALFEALLSSKFADDVDGAYIEVVAR